MPRNNSVVRRTALSLAVLLAGSRITSAATTDNYTGADNGLWSVPGNWSAGVPNNAGGQTYGVFIQSPALTVQLDTWATIDTLSVGATATLRVLPNSSLTIAGGALINNGTLLLDNGTSAQLLLSADTLLSGGGSIQLAGSSNRIDSVAIVRLISDNAISGEGNIGNSGGLLKIVNLGSITATTGRLTLNASTNPNVTDSFLNLGTLAADGGALALSGGSYDNSSGIIEARVNSVVTINSGVTVNGGILRSTGGTVTLGSDAGNATLTNTALSGLVQTGTTGGVTLLGSLSNAGTLASVGGSLSFGTAWYQNPGAVLMTNTGLIQAGPGSTLGVCANTTLAGGGTLVLDNNNYTSNYSYSNSNTPYRLTNNGVITGRGMLGYSGSYDPLLTNAGTITATTGVLSLVGGTNTNLSNPMTNNINTGTLRADGGTLAIVDFRQYYGLTNTGGVIEALANSVVTISSSNIYGGTIRAVDGGTVTLNAGLSGTTLQGIIKAPGGVTFYDTNTNAGTLTVNGTLSFGFYSYVQTNPPPVTLVNAGLIQLGATSGPLSTLTIAANTTLTGGGTLALNGNRYINSSYNGNIPYLLTNNSIITGGGTIGSTVGFSPYGPLLANNGTITATTGVLSLVGSDYPYNNSYPPVNIISNTGTLRADGGTLAIVGSRNISNSTPFDNTGGVIEALANSLVTISGPNIAITGGTIRSVGGGTVSLSAGLSGTALQGIIQSGGVTFYDTNTNAGTLTVHGRLYFGFYSSGVPNTSVTLVNTGLMQLGVTTGYPDTLTIAANTTLSGSGTLVLDGNNYVGSNYGSGPPRLTNSSSISGRGTLGSLGSPNGPLLTNTGTISATTGVLSLVGSGYYNSSAPVNNTNIGTLRADGGTLAIVGPGNGNIQFANTGGVIEALAHSVVTISGTNITGGTIRSVGGGTVTISSTSSLNGTQGGLALGGLIQNTGTMNLTGPVTNAGTLVLNGTTYFGPNPVSSSAPAGVTLNNTGLIQINTPYSLTADTTLTGGGTMTLNGNVINNANLNYNVRLTNNSNIAGVTLHTSQGPAGNS